MKITFVISQLGGGGAERVVATLCNKLSERGHSVTLVTFLEYTDTYELSARVEHKRFACNAKNILQQVFAIRKVLKKNNSGVVIAFLPMVIVNTALANMGLTSKLIVSERNDPSKLSSNKLKRILRDLAFRHADGFVFQTEDAKAYFGSIAKTGVIIPNPLSEKIPAICSRDKEKCFITAARLDNQKNLPMMIDAFSMFYKAHPDYRLKIFGEGSERAALQERIDVLGLTDVITLEGFSKNIYAEMEKAQAFLLSSDYEGMSNSMLEALAMALPVVSTDHPIGGARMFIQNERNGLLVPVNDADSMCRAMERVVTEEWAKDLTQEAKDLRMRLSADTIADRWETYIARIAQE